MNAGRLTSDKHDFMIHDRLGALRRPVTTAEPGCM
jgi:hypothetical protein